MELLRKYAYLLVDYCLDLKAGEKLYVDSTTLAEPLLREIYRAALQKGAVVDINMSFSEQSKIFMDHATPDQLKHVSPLYAKAMETYDAYLYVRAPYNLRETKNVDKSKLALRKEATKPFQQLYFERTAAGTMKRSLCQYPTHANAQEAGMSLEEYTEFVFNACHLYADDPKAEWLKVRKSQQKIADFLNKASTVRYVNGDSDIQFSVKGRHWINSDGRANMPSGEVFSAPIEDSVNGKILFDYPSIFMGEEVNNISLEVENGKVTKWSADRGQEVLDKVFSIEGANFFGEVAIGTNYQIQRATKNILFDEKIGGTIHMAVGQSYKQCGGKNQSSIHWDLIKDMKDGGKIFVDDELVYQDGKFLIFG